MDIVSSTTSSTPAPSPSGLCQVCPQEGHGVHFGAFTCRACAAFFRRCHFSPKNEARCTRHNGKCKPKSGRWFCKKCRLDRCLELGMTTDNIQYHRDTFSSSVNFVKDRTIAKRLKDRIEVPMTVETALGIPHLITFLPQNAKVDMPYVELTELVEKARAALLTRTVVGRKERTLSDLEQLALGLENHNSSQKERVSKISTLSRNVQINDWDVSMCATARWLACSERIRGLDEDVKLSMLQSIWLTWGRLERIAMTAKMRVNGFCGKKQFVISHDSLIDYDELTADISWGSQHSFQELAYFFVPTEIYYDEIITEVIDVRPDSVELAFLLLSICLSIAGSRNNRRIEKETEELHDAMANDLHNYYVRKGKTVYSGRLKQLMRIKEHFLILWKRRTEKFRMGTFFEIFRMQFSVPGYFHTPC